MLVTSLGSGSSGNSLLVSSGQTCLLIDAGVAARRVKQALAKAGGPIGPALQLNGILLSHEHHDHVRGLATLLKGQRCPVWSTEGTRGYLSRSLDCQWLSGACQTPFIVGDIEIDPIAVSHDAAEPVGFVLSDSSHKVAVFTDLGCWDEQHAAAVASADLVVIEANYDERMLWSGGYPARLKRRISASTGHLSNADCASLLAASLNGDTREIWLAHLSLNNNHPEVAREQVITALGDSSSLPEIVALPRNVAGFSWDSARPRPKQARLW